MRSRTLWLLMVMAVLCAGPAFAQGGAGSTGSIQGQVVDESGAVVPGVSVTATSPVLLVPQTTISNAQGLYRFPGLPAGTYKVTFEMPGFRTVNRDGIRSGIGFTANVNPTLAVKQMQEEATVVGESPTIDTTATRVQTNFDKTQLDALPNARDMWSLLAETPAVTLNRFDVGGSTAGTQTTYVAYGNGGQNRPLIEGINTTEGTSAAGFYFDYGSFDEVIVGAAGNSAEMPSGGVLTNFIGKSGGNQFKGEVYYEYENRNIQSNNVSSDQLARGYANIPKNVIQQLGLKRNEANTLLDYKNLNASVGGPVVKDKLWFWAGYLRQQNVTYQPASGAILDGTEFLTKLVNYTGKLSYQMTQRDKFIAYLQYGTKFQPFRTDAIVNGPQHLTKDSTLNQESPSWVGKLEYNRTFGNRGFLEVRAGEFGYNFSLVGNGNDPRREDRTTLIVTGGGRDWELDRRRRQLHGAYTFYVDQAMGGNHQFKVGGEIQNETGRTRWKQYYSDNVVQLFNNGAPLSVRLGLPVDSWNGLRNYGLFVTDSYTRHRLTLNLGARYDRYRVFLPEQDRPASRFSPQAAHFDAVDNVKTFNHVAPRIGVVYNVTGEGKTVLKANYGRYYFNPGVTLADSVNPNTSTQYCEYNWTDRNGDRLWEAGEEGTLTSTGCQGGTASVSLDPNLKNSRTDELSTWIEQELPGQIGARVGFVWKMDRDGYQQENRNRPLSAYNVPITVVDPGPDGTRGTADDSTVSMMNLNPANLSLPVANYVYNPPGFDANYRSIEVAANKSFSHRWSMVGSFLYTWTDEYGSNYFNTGSAGIGGQNPSLFSGFALQTGFPITDADRNTRNKFGTWTLKAFGTWEPAWGLRLTPLFRAQQGYPAGRVFTASSTSGAPGSAGVNYGNQPLHGEPITAHRLQTYKQLDFRAEKRFTVTGRAKLGVIVDVYNVFNANTELNIRSTTGRLVISETGANIPTFLTPVTILPPRIVRLSARLEW